MRGILKNTKNGWMIRYFVLPTTDDFSLLSNDLGFDKVRLLGDDIKDDLKDSTIVEFEIVDCNGYKYGKIINEVEND